MLDFDTSEDKHREIQPDRQDFNHAIIDTKRHFLGHTAYQFANILGSETQFIRTIDVEGRFCTISVFSDVGRLVEMMREMGFGRGAPLASFKEFLLPALELLEERNGNSATSLIRSIGILVQGGVSIWDAAIRAAGHDAPELMSILQAKIYENDYLATWLTDIDNVLKSFSFALEGDNAALFQIRQILEPLSVWHVVADVSDFKFQYIKGKRSFGVEIEVWNNDHLEQRTPPTACPLTLKKYLDGVIDFFRNNQAILITDAFWTLHLNVGIADERQFETANSFQGVITKIAELFMRPWNPIEKVVGGVFRHTRENQRESSVCGGMEPSGLMQEGYGRFEFKFASVWAGANSDVIIEVMQIVAELIEDPKRLMSILQEIDKIYLAAGVATDRKIFIKPFLESEEKRDDESIRQLYVDQLLSLRAPILDLLERVKSTLSN